MDAIVGGERLDDLARGVAEHPPKLCDGGPCPLHARTRHHMAAWPQFHGRRLNLTVRECPHGAYHPDPDDYRWRPQARREHAIECDGCCEAPRGRHAPGEAGVVVGGAELGMLAAGVVDHSGRHCDGDDACPLHGPTDHHMREWPQFHGDTIRFTVRECPHGMLHPDPDDRRWGRALGHALECDGCCQPRGRTGR